MQTIGIVAEYNPFHTGHQYQIEQSRQIVGRDAGVVAVMSGNWVQQADCAIFDKWVRTHLALMGGADLVLELPTVWATASAESFAYGAVSILNAPGIVDFLSFGSECGDLNGLVASAACLDSEAYRENLFPLLNRGLPFAAARQQAVERCIGQHGTLLAAPNNNLGVEYIRALNRLHSTIRPITVLRQGSPHNGVLHDQIGHNTGIAGQTSPEIPRFLSATQLRLDISAGRWNLAEPYLLPGCRRILENGAAGLPSLERVSRAILAKVRSMSAEDWTKFPDSGAAEGLPQRLARAGQACTTVEEFFELSKTKRYTRARLERLALRAYLGITASEIPASPPYLRVLGFNRRGQELLREIKKHASLPILTKPAHARALDQTGRTLFHLEARCTDLYDLCFEYIPTPGREWTCGPVIIQDE